MDLLLTRRSRIITSSESPKSQSSDNPLSLAANVAADSPGLQIYELNFESLANFWRFRAEMLSKYPYKIDVWLFLDALWGSTRSKQRKFRCSGRRHKMGFLFLILRNVVCHQTKFESLFILNPTFNAWLEFFYYSRYWCCHSEVSSED